MRTQSPLILGKPQASWPRFTTHSHIGDPREPYEVHFRLYRTQGGNLVFTVADAGDDMFGVTHHAVYRSLSTLREDEHLQKADPVARAEFLDKCSAQLGEEWAVWID
jgi:hypothetical protein